MINNIISSYELGHMLLLGIIFPDMLSGYNKHSYNTNTTILLLLL